MSLDLNLAADVADIIGDIGPLITIDDGSGDQVPARLFEPVDQVDGFGVSMGLSSFEILISAVDALRLPPGAFLIDGDSRRFKVLKNLPTGTGWSSLTLQKVS